MKYEARKSLQYLLESYQPNSAAISWPGVKLAKGIEDLLYLPDSLKFLSISNIEKVFSKRVLERWTVNTQHWIYNLVVKLTSVCRIKLVNCRYHDGDLQRLRSWLPSTKIIRDPPIKISSEPISYQRAKS